VAQLGEGEESSVTRPQTIVNDDALERVITRMGERLVYDDLTRDDRAAVWSVYRSLIVMRSQERVAQMERERGLR
jgi:hypothetical protein